MIVRKQHNRFMNSISQVGGASSFLGTTVLLIEIAYCTYIIYRYTILRFFDAD